MQSEIRQAWGDFLLDIQLRGNVLNIKFKDRMTGKQYAAQYLFNDLPAKIKAMYGSLHAFLEELQFIIDQKDYDRLEIRNDGQFIFGLSYMKAGRKIIQNQILMIQQQEIDIDHTAFAKLVQNFQVQQHNNSKLFESINTKIKKLEQGESKLQVSFKNQAEKQSILIIDLQKRIQVLENMQKEQPRKDQQIIQEVQKLKTFNNETITNINTLKSQINDVRQELNNFTKGFTDSINQIKISIDSKRIRQERIISSNYFCPNISSILETKKDCQNLFNLCLPLKIKQLKLIFKASEHNFLASQFHEKCDGISNTLTLIKTNENKIIGGYTKCKWQSINGYVSDGDGGSFLISLTNMHKLKAAQGKNNIYNYQKHGPIFAGGHDLSIANQSNLKDSCQSNIGHNYINNQHYPKDQAESFKKFTGNTKRFFSTNQWQVFAVIFA